MGTPRTVSTRPRRFLDLPLPDTAKRAIPHGELREVLQPRLMSGWWRLPRYIDQLQCLIAPVINPSTNCGWKTK